jgi:hypothetical protein
MVSIPGLAFALAAASWIGGDDAHSERRACPSHDVSNTAVDPVQNCHELLQTYDGVFECVGEAGMLLTA